ncbi:MAG: acyl-CoA thioester hydrolase [Pseudonocardiales bacterium]|nr:acyl-CoA thioester hydrolase [Pseudonocardiales bacterium]
MHPTTLTVQLRFADFDPLNHVNNVAFFELMETARIEVMRSAAPRSLRGHMVVRHASCDYEGEIRGGVRAVDVTVGIEKIGTSSFTLLHEIRAAGELVAIGRVVMVALDESRLPRPLTDEERADLEG